jgi:transposase
VQLLQSQVESTLAQLSARLALLEQAHRDELIEQRKTFEAQLHARDLHIKLLTEQLYCLRAEQFGKSSEKFNPDQLALAINEAEALTAAVPPDALPAGIVVPEHVRKRRGHRKALPSDLPQVEVIHDLDESEKICPHDGSALEKIGAEESKQLDYVPAKLQVLVHKRLKYACPCCDRTVKIAAAPPQLLPKSNASPGLIAQVVTAKYVDGAPLYRQETQWERRGLRIPRVTLARWTIEAGDKVVPLINLMSEHCLLNTLIHMDETPLQVLKSHKAPTSDHYMWVRCAGPPGKRTVLFDYDPSRGSAVPTRLLEGYRGTLMTDGWEAYDIVCAKQTLLHAGCWAHARRKFEAAYKAGAAAQLDRNRAGEMLALIGELYRVERRLKDNDAQEPERLHARQTHSKLIVERIHAWLIEQAQHVLTQSLLGKAITYTLNQWNKLSVFLDHPSIPLDNNRAENVIRPFVIGRKNWLFADTQAGAHASARLYTLVETAKANGLEPHAYLTRLFTELPTANTVDDIERLLPFKQP